MSPANLILRDYLIRRWWIWAIGLPANAFYLWAVSTSNHLEDKIFVPFIMFLGSFLLIFDLQKGCARALLSLPISVRELAHLWRWEAVALPFLVSTTLNTIVLLIYCGFKGTWHFFPTFILYSLGNLILLGVMFFALTGMPSAQQQGRTFLEKTRSNFFGILWAISFTGFYFFARWFNPDSLSGLILITIAAILTIWGWFRADLLVQERVGFRLAVQKGGQTKADSRCAEGRGGLIFLMQHLISRMLMNGFFMLVIFGVSLGFNSSNHLDTHLKDQFSRILVGNPIILPMLGMIMVLQFLPVCMQLRFLRTLPCSANRLAAFMIFTPILALLTLFTVTGLLLASVLDQPILPVLESLPAFPCAIMILIVPLLVWIGWGIISGICLFVGMIGSTVVTAIGLMNHWGLLTPATSLALSALILLAAFLLTKLAIERSSRTYRPRSFSPNAGFTLGGGR